MNNNLAVNISPSDNKTSANVRFHSIPEKWERNWILFSSPRSLDEYAQQWPKRRVICNQEPTESEWGPSSALGVNIFTLYKIFAWNRVNPRKKSHFMHKRVDDLLGFFFHLNLLLVRLFILTTCTRRRKAAQRNPNTQNDFERGKRATSSAVESEKKKNTQKIFLENEFMFWTFFRLLDSYQEEREKRNRRRFRTKKHQKKLCLFTESRARRRIRKEFRRLHSSAVFSRARCDSDFLSCLDVPCSISFW